MINSSDLLTPLTALTKSKQQATLLSLARILVFFAAAALLIIGLTDHPFYLLLFPLLFFGFIYLILAFNKANDKQAILQQVISIQQEKVLRNSRNLKPLNGGQEFIDKNHPFSSDLDLFGEFSLFQLINHTVTSGGKNLLADWLKSPFDAQNAQKRHAAIKELSKKEEFLITFESSGKALHQKEKSKSFFFEWVASEENFPKFLLPFIFLGPIVGLSLIVAHLFMDMHPSFVGVWILLGIVFISFIFKSLLKAAKALPDTGNIKTFSLWSQLIEKENFDDPYLQHLQQPFRIAGIQASKVLKNLEQINFLINNRINLMYLIFNLLFWLDLPIYYKLLVWKKKYGNQLSLWEKTFEKWQVLISLAAFEADEQQNCSITWSIDNDLKFQNVRHPLIENGKAVGNDFSLNDQEKVVLLTGANMSGKTTFMRTLGINLVMAHLGLTPFADAFTSGNFQLYTSMRNSDNLGESMSSFYAELSRIKSLILRVEKGENMFFLLDEILKGTNTSDRIMGSKALILQLSKGAKGIISTHDIELSQLEESLPFLVNKSFHSEIHDHEILFDYKIKEGPCPNFNAQKLMELMGIML
jgi:ABC-type multidrug transport system fused ATPase/permease subunit